MYGMHVLIRRTTSESIDVFPASHPFLSQTRLSCCCPPSHRPPRRPRHLPLIVCDGVHHTRRPRRSTIQDTPSPALVRAWRLGWPSIIHRPFPRPPRYVSSGISPPYPVDRRPPLPSSPSWLGSSALSTPSPSLATTRALPLHPSSAHLSNPKRNSASQTLSSLLRPRPHPSPCRVPAELLAQISRRPPRNVLPGGI